jgi:hypothetical protein
MWYNIDAQFCESIEFSGTWSVRNVCEYICNLLAFKLTILYVDDKKRFFISRPCLTSVSKLLILIFIFYFLHHSCFLVDRPWLKNVDGGMCHIWFLPLFVYCFESEILFKGRKFVRTSQRPVTSIANSDITNFGWERFESSRYCVGARIVIPSLKLRLSMHLYDLHITIPSEVPRTWTLLIKVSDFWFVCLVVLIRKLYRHVQKLLCTLCHPLPDMRWDP